MANVKDYWCLAPYAQDTTRRAVRGAEREEEAAEKEMLLLDGKLIKPEDWPCQCEKESPYDCFEEMVDCVEHYELEGYMDTAEKTCTCPCHTYWIAD